MGVHAVDEHPKEGSETSSLKFHSSSSASRLVSVPLRLFKSRSKSQTRMVPTSKSCWIPEGSCFWKDDDGHVVHLKLVFLLDITEPERIALKRLAVSRLNRTNLGFHVELPKTEDVSAHQSKRRPMLLRKKAATTDFLEGKEKGLSGHGTVFGIPLSQSVANDRLKLAEEDMQRQGYCEEVLSALRLSPKENETSTSSTDGSQTDTCSSENQGSTESLTWLERLDPSDLSSSLCGGSGCQVPTVVQNCISFLENKGLHTLGLFRVCGSKRRVRQLREDLDRNPRLTINDSCQPHDIAQLLKEFFRELPEPLLTRELYHPFIEIQKLRDPQRRLQATRWLLYLLPVVHRDTLAALLSFLSKVADYSEDYHTPHGTWVSGNKMNSNNLATVFGPNILRSGKGSKETAFPVQSLERAQERSDVILTVQGLIDNYTSLFQVPASDLDSAYRNLISDDAELLNAVLNRHMMKSGTETKKETEVKSRSSRCDECALGIANKNAREELFSTEINRKKLQNARALDIKSRFRPMIFSDTGCGEYSQMGRVQHQGIQHFSRNSNYESTITELASQQCGVSSSFIVTRASGGSSHVPQLKIYESDQFSSSRARRIPYGRIRHMTTPSYVSEEMSITITIPGRKQTQRLSNERQARELGVLSSFCGSHSNLTQYTKGISKSDKRIQAKSKTTGQYLSPPAPQEIWKRQEIIASEHIQL